MNVTILTAGVHGVEGVPVRVDVSVEPGSEGFVVEGAPAHRAEVAAKVVRVAVRDLGLSLRGHTVTAWASWPIDGDPVRAPLELPLTLGVLAGLGRLRPEALEKVAVLGELDMSGDIRGICGALPAARALAEQHRHLTEVIVPSANAGEAAAADGTLCFRIARRLGEVLAHLDGSDFLPRVASEGFVPAPTHTVDLADVHGQPWAKRALEIAAAGGHNVLLIGAAGSGKTMLARRLPGLMPTMTEAERLATSAVWSVAGLLRQRAAGLVADRPFRAPHHTASTAALVGTRERLGEVALAHNGVLFVDELAEWRKDTLDALVPVLRDRGTTWAGPDGVLTSCPGSFVLVAALLPCPCGFRHATRHRCCCSPEATERYLARSAGMGVYPLLDLRVVLDEVAPSELTQPRPAAESSATVRERVTRAWGVAAQRLGRPGVLNARMSLRQTHEHCEVPADASRLLDAAMLRHGLGMDRLDPVLRVARTIADLDGAGEIQALHVSEALRFQITERG